MGAFSDRAQLLTAGPPAPMRKSVDDTAITTYPDALRMEMFEKRRVDVSAYVQRRRGKLVAVSSYKRNVLAQVIYDLERGGKAKLPDGTEIRKGPSGKISVHAPGSSSVSRARGSAATTERAERAADIARKKSAASTKPRSHGGRQKMTPDQADRAKRNAVRRERRADRNADRSGPTVEEAYNEAVRRGQEERDERHRRSRRVMNAARAAAAQASEDRQNARSRHARGEDIADAQAAHDNRRGRGTGGDRSARSSDFWDNQLRTGLLSLEVGDERRGFQSDTTVSRTADGYSVAGEPPVDEDSALRRLKEIREENEAEVGRQQSADQAVVDRVGRSIPTYLSFRPDPRPSDKPLTVAQIRRLTDDERRDYLQMVSNRVQSTAYGPNYIFRRADSYERRLSRAGIVLPAHRVSPPPAFQD